MSGLRMLTMLMTTQISKKKTMSSMVTVDNNIPWVTVTVCHGVMDTMDNHLPWVMVMVCCSAVESDTMTITITTITK